MSQSSGGTKPVPLMRETELFTSGAEGHHTFRIPCLNVAKDGTILAFCEGRKYGREDFRSLYLVLKRSKDNGLTWEDMQVVVGDGNHIMHNPCAVVDRDTGTIWLTYNEDGDKVFVMSSEDSGSSWSRPADITRDVKRPSWTSYWTGPGHATQLENGRLVIPCTHVEGMRRDSLFIESHVFYSDDHGSSWKLGGTLEGYTTECEIVETQGGKLYMTIRSEKRGLFKRFCSWSEDGGISWSEAIELDDLPDPHCQASIVRFTDQDKHDKNRILFANCASTTRDTMTVRVSYDECKSWAASKVLHIGPCAYSDLAIAADMSICCFYERGSSGPYESIRLAQFSLDWLTEGADDYRIR